VKEFCTFIFREHESSFSIQPCLESVYTLISNLKSVFEMYAAVIFAEHPLLCSLVVCLLCDAWILMYFGSSTCLLVAHDL
jgi:hypothetical protein